MKKLELTPLVVEGRFNMTGIDGVSFDVCLNLTLLQNKTLQVSMAKGEKREFITMVKSLRAFFASRGFEGYWYKHNSDDYTLHDLKKHPAFNENGDLLVICI